MAIDIALLGFNGLGRLVTPTFLFRNRFYLQLSPQDFCPRDMESCHLAAARRVKIWSLNANLFFEKAHQLTKFAKKVHLNHIWQRTIPFKALIAIFWDLQPMWTSSLTKPDILRFRCSSGHVLSITKSVIPICFTFLISLTHQLSMVKLLAKKSMLENFRANVLKSNPLIFFHFSSRNSEN